MKIKKDTKHVLLGDMLELGESSVNHHKSIAKIINKLDIDKVHVFGKDIKKTYEVLKKNKQGVVIKNLSKINDLILKTMKIFLVMFYNLNYLLAHQLKLNSSQKSKLLQ